MEQISQREKNNNRWQHFWLELLKPIIERWHLKSEQDSMMRLIIAAQLSWLYLSRRADFIWSAFLALLKWYCQILTCKFRPGRWVERGSLHTEIKHILVGGCGGRDNKNLYIQTSQPIRLLYFKIPEVIIFGWAAELIEYQGGQAICHRLKNTSHVNFTDGC